MKAGITGSSLARVTRPFITGNQMICYKYRYTIHIHIHLIAQQYLYIYNNDISKPHKSQYDNNNFY